MKPVKTELYHDHFQNYKRYNILIGELAKILKQNGINVGQNRLFDYLRNKGYLIRQKGEQYNMPSQKSLDMELMVIKTSVRSNPDGSNRVNRTPKVTPKGQQYFVNKFLAEVEIA